MQESQDFFAALQSPLFYIMLCNISNVELVPKHLMLTNALYKNININLPEQITVEQTVKHEFPHCLADALSSRSIYEHAEPLIIAI